MLIILMFGSGRCLRMCVLFAISGGSGREARGIELGCRFGRGFVVRCLLGISRLHLLSLSLSY